MKFQFLSLFVALCVGYLYSGTIIESGYLEDVYRYISPYDNHENCIVLWDVDRTLAYGKWQVDENGDPLCVHLSPAQSDIANIIWQVHHDVSTFVLTKRWLEITDCTFMQLHALGLNNFSQLFDYELTVWLDDWAVYKDGVVFCGENDKGMTLFYMLDRAGWYPDKIILVDDKFENLVSVETMCEQRGIEFIGLRYNRYDNVPRGYHDLFD